MRSESRFALSMSFFSSSEGDWTGLVFVLRAGRFGDSAAAGKCELKGEPTNELDDEDAVDDDDDEGAEDDNDNNDDDDEENEDDEVDEEAELDDELEVELNAADVEEAGAAFSSKKLL